MTQVEQLREAVNKAVAEQFIPTLFDRMARRHSSNRKTYRGCSCSYCDLKRDATFYIGTASYPPYYTGYRPTGSMVEEGESFRALKRNFIRVWYRNKLNEESKEFHFDE